MRENEKKLFVCEFFKFFLRQKMCAMIKKIVYHLKKVFGKLSRNIKRSSDSRKLNKKIRDNL